MITACFSVKGPLTGLLLQWPEVILIVCCRHVSRVHRYAHRGIEADPFCLRQRCQIKMKTCIQIFYYDKYDLPSYECKLEGLVQRLLHVDGHVVYSITSFVLHCSRSISLLGTCYLAYVFSLWNQFFLIFLNVQISQKSSGLQYPLIH